MKTVLIIFSMLLLLSACSKKKECTAKNVNGEAMFQTVGQDLCEDQISTENGEYCDCED